MAWKGQGLAFPEFLGGREGRAERLGALDGPTEGGSCSTRQASDARSAGQRTDVSFRMEEGTVA